MVGVTKSVTALLGAFIRSKKMKGTWKIADSTSRAYKRGLIIGGVPKEVGEKIKAAKEKAKKTTN